MLVDLGEKSGDASWLASSYEASVVEREVEPSIFSHLRALDISAKPGAQVEKARVEETKSQCVCCSKNGGWEGGTQALSMLSVGGGYHHQQQQMAPYTHQQFHPYYYPPMMMHYSPSSTGYTLPPTYYSRSNAPTHMTPTTRSSQFRVQFEAMMRELQQ